VSGLWFPYQSETDAVQLFAKLRECGRLEHLRIILVHSIYRFIVQLSMPSFAVIFRNICYTRPSLKQGVSKNVCRVSWNFLIVNSVLFCKVGGVLVPWMKTTMEMYIAAEKLNFQTKCKRNCIFREKFLWFYFEFFDDFGNFQTWSALNRSVLSPAKSCDFGSETIIFDQVCVNYVILCGFLCFYVIAC
jgi:hypothetical protein